MPRTRLNPTWLLIALVTLYSLAHLLWYLDTPLGQSPVLDGQENLLLARQIADGTLEREPFFRAMLYPAVIAFFPLGHSLLGLICHLANTLLSIALARRFWQNERAALLAGILVGFNPVLLHFAFDPLDTTLAITFFLTSILTLQKSVDIAKSDNSGLYFATLSGLSISLAALTRPHFLLTLFALIVIAIIACIKQRLSHVRLASYLGAIMIPLLATGFVQKSISGSFRIMPWQGAYNLYVSNNESANGLYYRQKLSFQNLDEHQNPARLEEAARYLQGNGKPGTIEERNAYWRSQTLQEITDSPLRWLRLEAFKLYASLNNYEQYNNKTYSFHKSLSPFLRYNPIGWGLLLAVSCFSIATLWLQIKSNLIPIFVVALSIFGGLLIFMASARFRLPLVPLAAILAAGLPVAWSTFMSSRWRTKRRAIIVTSTAAFIGYSQFAGVASKQSYLQDSLLLADASARIGDDALAVQWSEFTLAMNPRQQQALRTLLVSRYNQIASGEISADHENWQKLKATNTQLGQEDELLSFISGVISWNLGEQELAIKEWKNGYARFGQKATPCLAALERVGHPIKFESLPLTVENLIRQGNHRLYATAIAETLEPAEREKFLQEIGLAPASYQSISQSLARILPLS